MQFDIESVRKQFPGLSGDWILMDNAGGSQVAQPVIDRLIDYLGLRAQNGVVRVSMVHYNTEEEVNRLIAALDQVL